MNIIIKDANMDRINEEILKVEGRARERVMSYYLLRWAIEDIEKHLGIAKKDMIDLVVDIDYHAQDFPRVYKYTPMSTHATIKRTSSGWSLQQVDRMATRRTSERYRVTLTEQAKRALIDRMTVFS